MSVRQRQHINIRIPNVFVPAAEANIPNITVGIRVQPLEHNILERVLAVTDADQAVVDADPVTLERGGAAEPNPCHVNNGFPVDLDPEPSIPVTPQDHGVVRAAVSLVMVPLAPHILPENQRHVVAGVGLERHAAPTGFPELQILPPRALEWRHCQEIVILFHRLRSYGAE